MKNQWILALAMAVVLGAAMPRVAAAQQPRWGTPAPQDRRFDPPADLDQDDEEMVDDQDFADEELPAPAPPRRTDRAGQSRWDRDRQSPRRSFQRQPMLRMVHCYTPVVPPSTPFYGLPNQPCVTVTPMGPIQGIAR